MATHDSRSGNDFVPFFRRYAKSWVHAVAAAGMTAFGTLTIVHRGFAVLALAAYVLPPIVLYLRRPSADRTAGDPAVDRERAARPTGAAGEESAAETEPLEDTESGEHTETDGRTESGTHADRAGAPTGAAVDRRGREPEAGGDVPADDEGRAERTRDWRVVDVPTEATLRGVCATARGAVYAVGEDGVVLTAAPLAGRDAGEWSITLEDGPAAAGEDLLAVDATDDGDAVWVAGDSGAVGRIDAETGRHTDYTAPADVTDNWLGVAVGGAGGDETILLINGSGAVLRGRYRDGDCSWDDPVKPGDGSSLSGIALADASVGYCCDTNDGVFETTDGGESFDRVGLGGASGTLESLATLGRGDCLVSADDGVVHRYGGSTWTPERVGEEAICGLARREGETIACDADGAIYERTDAAGWKQVETRAPESLIDVSVAPDGARAVAVGEDGTVVERR
ncbi:WD40/YVTN/BNR-like repeat-containing protein [Natrinema salaciae]|uniref:Uncharacterized protein n=1 Tax=Natrinema salaciae TaxID=1186196 RepID=A0A1H9MC86_9EURY|nr:hypothetical protein [Natrinema salaciae]SER21308.1 hypothetical protein SAMN04489841_3304 [Natrinema salaciae]